MITRQFKFVTYRFLLIFAVILLQQACASLNTSSKKQASADSIATGEKTYEKLLEKKSKNTQMDAALEEQLAKASWKLGRYRTCIWHSDNVIRSSRDAKIIRESFQRMIECSIKLGQWTTALKDIERAEKAAEGFFPEKHKLKAEVFMNLSRWNEALEESLRYDESGAASDKTDNLLRIITLVTEILDRGEDAVAYYRRLPPAGDDALGDRIRLLRKKIGFKSWGTNEGLAEPSLSALQFDGDDLWIGTWLSGVARMNVQTGEIKSFKALKYNFVANTVRDIRTYQKKIWIATFDGLTCYDKTTEKYTDYSDLFRGSDDQNPRLKAIVCGEGKVYAASLGGGLAVYNTADDKWQQYKEKEGFFDNQLTSLFLKGGKLYCGSLRKGLAVVDIKTMEWKRYGSAAGLTDPNVRDIYAGSNFVAVGSKDSGLFLFDSGMKLLTNIRRENSKMQQNYVSSIDSQANWLYLGLLGGGVGILNLKTMSLELVTRIDGLISDNVTEVTYRDGWLWVGTVDQGLCRTLVP